MRRPVGVKWVPLFFVGQGFFSRRVATVAMLPFALSNGWGPQGTMVEAPDGNLYGMAGREVKPPYGGVVFRFTPGGSLSTLYTFCPTKDCPTGSATSGSSLILAHSGSLYGTAVAGGADDLQFCPEPNVIGSLA